MKYWIVVVSRDHVKRGVAGGFMQANHGKAAGLRRMRPGDGVIFYSSKTTYEQGEPLQAFTAIGTVSDSEPYQVEMTPDFSPWRRTIHFMKSQEVPIRPLIDDLIFIQDKTHWGYKFRFGLFEIPHSDYELIAKQMNHSM